MIGNTYTDSSNGTSVYLPFVGRRNENGFLSGSDRRAWYWTALPHSSRQGHLIKIEFSEPADYNVSNYMNVGCSVRPVKDR